MPSGSRRKRLPPGCRRRNRTRRIKPSATGSISSQAPRHDAELPTPIRVLATPAPELCQKIPPFENRGRGECRVPNAPAASCALGVVGMRTSIHSGGTGYIRHSPRNGFNAYSALSPATNSSCHRRCTDCMASHIPVGLSVPPRALSTNNGCQDHTPSRPQHCRSSRAPFSIAHGLPALRPHAHTTSSRPPHPAPRFVTIGRNAPLHRGGMGRAYKSDLPDGLSEIFFARGLDRNSRSQPVGQITW
jgi:hypothetical protein